VSQKTRPDALHSRSSVEGREGNGFENIPGLSSGGPVFFFEQVLSRIDSRPDENLPVAQTHREHFQRVAMRVWLKWNGS